MMSVVLLMMLVSLVKAVTTQDFLTRGYHDNVAALYVAESGLAEQDPRFNLSWHDWMNLDNLILVSRTICVAALARENSRGAHFRDDFPDPGDLATSQYTVARLQSGTIDVVNRPVEFTRIRPSESLIRD